MTDSERISKLAEYSGLSIKKLSEEIGLKTVQTLYDIKNGKHGISKEVANKIKGKYLNINTTWLLTGEGDMFIDNSTQINNSGEFNNSGDINNTINTGEVKTEEFFKLTSKMLSQIDMVLEQANRILTIIEKKL